MFKLHLICPVNHPHAVSAIILTSYLTAGGGAIDIHWNEFVQFLHKLLSSTVSITVGDKPSCQSGAGILFPLLHS